MVRIMSFADALATAATKRHLLLGNGFSIALRPAIFSYESLYTSADFAEAPHLKSLFEALNTRDFEEVIRTLVSTAALLRGYDAVPPALISRIEEDAAAIKNILVQSIARNHPDRPFEISPAHYVACRNFLANFAAGHIYTLNYDVLLYWALMQDEVDDLSITPDDGFRHPEDNEDAPYVSWLEANSPTVHYLHGALHLFDAGAEIIKYTWSKTDIPLLEQIRTALDEDKYPLFVSEGDSRSKLRKILHSAYLHKAFRSFSAICEQKAAALFIYGHSLAENDDHIFRRISRGRIGQLFVSIYGDPSTDRNKVIIEKAQAVTANRQNRGRSPLDLFFFDAGSANVWTPQT